MIKQISNVIKNNSSTILTLVLISLTTIISFLTGTSQANEKIEKITIEKIKECSDEVNEIAKNYSIRFANFKAEYLNKIKELENSLLKNLWESEKQLKLKEVCEENPKRGYKFLTKTQITNRLKNRINKVAEEKKLTTESAIIWLLKNGLPKKKKSLKKSKRISQKVSK